MGLVHCKICWPNALPMHGARWRYARHKRVSERACLVEHSDADDSARPSVTKVRAALTSPASLTLLFSLPVSRLHIHLAGPHARLEHVPR